jgi:hypothetical protein
MKKAGVFSILFVVMLFAVAIIAGAQQPKKAFRMGYLASGSLVVLAPRIEGSRLLPAV